MKAGILIGHLKDKGNEGTIIRTAEAFGISHCFVIGKKEKIYKSSKGSDKHMTFFQFKNIYEFINYVKSNNHSLVCIENMDKSKDICDIESYPVNPIFIPGHENGGVPMELMGNAKICVKIKQGMGYGDCVNTAIAASIVIRDFFEKMTNIKKGRWA